MAVRAWVAYGVLVVVVRQVHIVCVAAPGKLQRRNTRLKIKALQTSKVCCNNLHKHVHNFVSLRVFLTFGTVRDCAVMTYRP